MDSENPPENGKWLKRAIGAVYFIAVVILIPFFIWPLVNSTSTQNPKMEAMVISTVFLVLTLPISIYSVASHLVNFNQPELQRPICRVLLMVPVYSLTSFLSLQFTQFSLYFDTLREWYEAYALYNFMALVLRFLLRNYDLRYVLEYKPHQPHIFPFCCLVPFPAGLPFIASCKSGVVQYCFVRTLTTLVALVTQLTDRYHEGEFDFRFAYLYLVVVNNISQVWAMYCLILLYYTMRVELRPLSPMLKFAAIKILVFLTFWQSVLLALLVWTKVLTPNDAWAWKTPRELSNGLQAFVIIIEMFALSLMHHHAFPVAPFIAGGFNQFGTASWSQQIRSLWDHSDITEDVREHVRVIGGVVQDARGRLGHLLHQSWPPGNDEQSSEHDDADDQPLITS